MASRRPGAGSVLWGLILVAVGSVLLARNIGYDIPIWTGIATYWPLLLIVWGGVKVIDYIQIRRRGEVRRLFSPGEVVLLIFVVLTGTAVSAAERLNPGLVTLLEMADIDLLPITGNEYDYTEHYETDAAPGATIEIYNRYGSIEVLPAEGDRIIVDVRKTVIANTQEDADELSEVLTFSIVEESPGYRVLSSFNRDQNSVRGRRFRTSLSVRVPETSSIRINNRNGNVTLADLQGDQSIDNQFGYVVVRDIDGNVALDNRNGTVTVNDVLGSVAIDNGFARTTVRNVAENLAVDTRNGDVDVSDIGGNVSIENAFAAVSVSNVNGNLALDTRNSAIDIENVGGSANVENAFQNIRLRDVRGEIRVTNQNGDVDVRLGEIPGEDIVVSTEFSDVSLEVPRESGFELDLFTRFGEIETDLGLQAATDGPERALTGTVGEGGPLVRIRTRNGNISVNRM